MTHTDYTTEALKTWTAPLRNTPDGIAYLQLGLLSEVGECYGVLKRILRDKTPMDVAQARFEDELGDVLWYCAVLEWEKAQDWFDPALHDSISCSGHEFGHELQVITWCASDLGLDASDAARDRARVRNIAKLRDRAARGVITGEGGDR